MPRNSSYFKSALYFEQDKRLAKPAWLATVYIGGKRERKRFRTKADAEGWIDSRRTETEKLGVQLDELPRAVLQDAVDARAKLGGSENLSDAVGELLAVRDVLGTGKALLDSLEEWTAARKELGGRVGIREAAKFWTVHNPSGGALTLGELCEKYLAAPRRGGSSPSHLHALQQRFRSLQETLGTDTPVASIMPDTLQTFLAVKGESQGWSPASFNAWCKTFKSLFAYADAKHGTGNPAAGIELQAVKRHKIEYYSPEQAAALLHAAERVAPDFAAALAILFFAGVRPTELIGQYGEEGAGELLGGLTWNRVDVDGEITLDAEVTKTGQQRTVPISANLAAWLARYGKERGRVVPNPTAWKRARARIVAASGVEWGQDWARHSFATYHYALHRNRDALEAAMGHTQGGSVVLERHYKGLEKRKAAETFWAIKPQGRAK